MAISAGSVAVRVVPSAETFVKDLKAQILPQASTFGVEIGKEIGAGVAKGLGDPISGPLDDSAKRQRSRAPKSGEEIGGAFAAGFKRRLQTALASLPKIKIDADSSDADKKLAELRTRMETLAGKTIGVDIDAAAALAELNAIKVELGKLGENASIDVRADTATAISQLDAVQAQAARLAGETANIQVDADTAKADAELAATGAEVERLDGRKASIEIDTSGAVSSLLRLTGVVAGLGPLFASAGVAGAAAIAALAAPAAAAAAGLGAMALVAVPAITRIKTALDAQQKATEASAAGSVQAQSRALAEAAAQQQLAAAVRNAAFAHQQALDQVRSAEQQLTSAQQAATNAQRALNEARLEAQRQLEDMANRVVDAQLAVRQSTFDVADAQANYNRTVSNPAATQDQIARAKLALDQAKQSLKEQQVALKRLRADQAAADKAGVEGSNAVRSARQQLAAANQQVTNSERALAAARANVARADQTAADQIASAQRSAAQAALQGASANSTLAQSMAALSPAARGLMRAWQGFSGVFTRWQASLEPTVLPVLARGLNVLRGVFPLITPVVQGAARALDGLFTALGRTLASPAWRQFATVLGQLVGSALATFGQVGLQVATTFVKIINAFAPFTPVVLGFVRQFGNFVALIGQNIASLTPIIAPLFGLLGQLLRALGPLLTSAVQALIPVIAGLAPILGAAIRYLQPVISALVAGLKPILIAIVPYVGLLVHAIGQILVALAPILPVLGSFIAALITGLMPILRPIITVITQLATRLAGALITTLRAALPSVQQIVLAIASLLPALLPLIPLWVQWEMVLLPLIPPILRLVAILATLLVPVVRVVITVLVSIATTIMRIVIPVFRFLVNIVTWAINAVHAVFKWLYDVLIGHSIIPDLVRGIRTWFNVLAGVFRWLYTNVVHPVINSIGSVIHLVWVNTIKPVFDAIKSGISRVADAFKTGAKAISANWDKIKSYTSAPVRFVIDRVINHGILWAWDTVAKWLHLPGSLQIPYLKLPFADGGIVQYYANGGVENHTAQIAPAGAMRVWAEPETGGEAYIPLASSKRGRSTAILSTVADMFGYGLVPMADGGFWGTIGKVANGLIGKGLSFSKAALSAVTDPAKWILSHLTQPVKALLAKVDDSNFGRASVTVGEKTLSAMTESLRKLLDLFAGGGGSAMVQLARTQIGYHEGPGNSNKYSSALGRPAEEWWFAAGTLIDTPDGLVPIEELHPGSEVLTPSGAVARTSRLLTREKPLLRLTALGVPGTLVTEDHPYWAMRRVSPAGRKRELAAAEWVKVRDLRRGDMIALPIPADGNVAVDPALAYVLGMYLADGHRLHRDLRGVQISDAVADRERILAAFKAAGYEDVRVAENRTCLQFTVYDDGLYDLCGQFGDLAHGKRLPGVVFAWNRAARQALLDGYMDGDGSYDDRNGYRATTVSRVLAHDLGKLIRSLGWVPNIQMVRAAGTMMIEGRRVHTRDTYGLKWKTHPSPRPQTFVADGKLWVPIRSIEDTGRVETVYDLTVPGEHAFVADGAHVSNCADFIDWLALKTGNRSAVPWTASAPGMARAFGSRYVSGTAGAVPGDIVFFGPSKAGIYHVGLAAGPARGGAIPTIAGNHGDAVRAYTGTGIAGYAHPNYPNPGSVGSAPGSLVHASPSVAQAWARQNLKDYGWSLSQYSPLVKLWNRESNWRWNALNRSSGAYGIPQSLPASKMRSAGADWRDNAGTQIKWGLGYIRGRYGSPAAAWSHETRVGWYDQGGWLPPGPSLVYNGTGSPEAVFTGAQLDALINGSSGGGVREYHAHFDGLTGAAIETHVRTAFHAMEVSAGSRERVGRRR